MTKKTEEKKEIKINYPVEFEIQRDYLKKIKKSHKNFVGYYPDGHILSCYHFEIENNRMKVYTTDGDRALKSEFEINNLSNQSIKFDVSGSHINSLVVLNALTDFITVSVEVDKITFNDYANGFSVMYKLGKNTSPYPNVEQIFESYANRKNYQICINHSYFNDMKVLQSNDRTKRIKLKCDTKSNTQAILVETGSIDFIQTALLMPIREQ